MVDIKGFYFNAILFLQPVMDAIRTAVTDVGTFNIPNTVMDFVTQMLGLTPVLEEAQHANDEVKSLYLWKYFYLIDIQVYQSDYDDGRSTM